VADVAGPVSVSPPTKPCDTCSRPTPTTEPTSRWCDECGRRHSEEGDVQAVERLLVLMRSSAEKRRRRWLSGPGEADHMQAVALNVMRRLLENWV
jgi:hypothetical protein